MRTRTMGSRLAGGILGGVVLAVLLSTGSSNTEASTGCTQHRFPTEDGLQLEADWCPAGDALAPILILLHMIPPHNDRSNYPPALRSEWVQGGYSILNVDRRGAGNSSGKAKDAYEGPKGLLDLKASHRFLTDHGFAPKAGNWGCVGASNGTTTCLDFVQQASGDPALAPPGAMVFLTGGRYTENNTTLAGSAAASIPSLFVFNASENAWSEAQRSIAGPGSAWLQLQPGGHGTRAFASHGDLGTQILQFLDRHLKAGEAAGTPSTQDRRD